jgi:hypothetical protein
METSILPKHRSRAAAQPGQSAPRNFGFCAPVTQSAEVEGMAAAMQSPRLSSARANNSASFGSFPDVRRISRLNIQPTAARRAGMLSPWQDQPDIRTFGSSSCLMKPTQDAASLASAASRSSVTGPNLLSMTPAASSSAPAFGVHAGGDFGQGGS